ncbi:MAG TPA: abortive infection family protein [Mucilaginibacter sp.]|nr:abortive infection family protein [Mucilaginibacter sp.]
MSDISYDERRALEKFISWKNGPGYVLDFSDKSFNLFVGDATGIDIDHEKYRIYGNSKANRLSAFVKLESDANVGKLLGALYEHKVFLCKKVGEQANEQEFTDLQRLSKKLLGEQVVENIDAIKAINDDKDFNQLAKLIRESIEKNQPEAALDRLHTFMFKFIRELCDRHGIAYGKEENLNATYGHYIKGIRGKGFIESDMADKIIQYSFQVMQAFNDIRNNKSFAHDNPVLNYDESVLIFANVTASVKFIQAIEAKNNVIASEEAKPDWGDF